jgi:DNA-binding transcriptional ArsR family regulator
LGTDDAAEKDRLERLERTVDDLAAQVAALADGGSDAAAPSALPVPAAPAAPAAQPDGPTDIPAAFPEQFWALNALREHVPSPGGVVYAGSVDLPTGHLDYQWARGTEALREADWADRAPRLDALGHPLRLAILRLLLGGEYTVAQIVDELELASTGVAYHHLNHLQTGGWVTSPRRGAWTIPAGRVIPLLTIITALEEN